MAAPSDLVVHYSSLAFYTRIAALTFVGAVAGATLDQVDSIDVRHAVGVGLVFVVLCLGELNRRFTSAYISACRASSEAFSPNSGDARILADRWLLFRLATERNWNTFLSRFFLYWLTYLPGLVLGAYLVKDDSVRLLLIGIVCLIVISGWLRVTWESFSDHDSQIAKQDQSMSSAPSADQVPPAAIPHLLEQYKAYLTDLGNLGSRQSQTNTWYVTILSGLVAFMGYLLQGPQLRPTDFGAIAAAAFVGMVLCVIWLFRAKSYQYLYDAKFTILREMEASGLPFKCYSREKQEISEKRRRFTTLEQWLSATLAIPFVITFVFAIVNLLS